MRGRVKGERGGKEAFRVRNEGEGSVKGEEL